MKEELVAGHLADVNDIADDLNQNLEKINHHGKRTESIVKGMLEHSRTSSGVKELIDFNKLTDEYIRISFQGLRAKNKDFRVELFTYYDEKLNVIAQDMGRVMLNLFNNAFYAVNQNTKTPLKKKSCSRFLLPSQRKRARV